MLNILLRPLCWIGQHDYEAHQERRGRWMSKYGICRRCKKGVSLGGYGPIDDGGGDAG